MLYPAGGRPARAATMCLLLFLLQIGCGSAPHPTRGRRLTTTYSHAQLYPMAVSPIRRRLPYQRQGHLTGSSNNDLNPTQVRQNRRRLHYHRHHHHSQDSFCSHLDEERLLARFRHRIGKSASWVRNSVGSKFRKLRWDSRGAADRKRLPLPGAGLPAVLLGMGALQYLGYTPLALATGEAAFLPELQESFRREIASNALALWNRLTEVASFLSSSGLPLLGLLSAACFFSLSETAITTLWPWKIKEMAMQEKNEGGALQSLRKDITRFLTTILIGGTLANIAVAAIITELSTQWLGPVGTSLATAISTVVIVLLCEIIPKAIAVQHPQQILRAVVYPLNLIAIVLYPLGHAATVFCNEMLKLFGIRGTAATSVTELELRMVLAGAEDSGQVTGADADMVEKVLQLGDTTVESVMTPLVDVVAVDQNATLSEMVELWKQFQYSRLPVFSDRIDNLVGVAFTKDLLNFAERPMQILNKAKVRHIMVQPPFFVPESMIVRKLLQEFQTRKFHMAVVVNEYGGVAGVVTLEDVLEEIVGEIFDETDIGKPLEARGVVRWGEGIWHVKGESPIDVVEEALGCDIPRGSSETIAGFVTVRFGRIPAVGESFEVCLNVREEEGEQDRERLNRATDAPLTRKYLFKVVSSNERQVMEVRIDNIPDEEDHGSEVPLIDSSSASPFPLPLPTISDSTDSPKLPEVAPVDKTPLDTKNTNKTAESALSNSNAGLPHNDSFNQAPSRSGGPFAAAVGEYNGEENIPEDIAQKWEGRTSRPAYPPPPSSPLPTPKKRPSRRLRKLDKEDGRKKEPPSQREPDKSRQQRKRT